MRVIPTVAAVAALAAGAFAGAQQTNQVQLKIEPSNRTLAVGAEFRVTADPEVAILHIGFETQPLDAKAAYAAGSKTSNDVVATLKQAGIEESAIRSASQSLYPSDGRSHKFRLKQEWEVKVPPVRAAEILDIAVTAGATDSGQIEWEVNDEKALENLALEKAAARAKADAAVLAGGMGARLGALVYVTNRIANRENLEFYGNATAGFSDQVEKDKARTHPLAIEPHKVSRTASVYAVYSLE